MTSPINVSTATKRWLEATLTAEEITRWGVDTIRALAQLESQVETLRANTDKPVVGGLIIWKTRGSANPANWRAITTLDKVPGLIEEDA